MKKTIVCAFALLSVMPLSSSYAQEIGKKELQAIQSSFEKTVTNRALQNVLSNNVQLRDLALNREKQGEMDHYFKYRVQVSGITDQKSSGRCWMFTSMNVLRPSVMEKYNIAEFDFSHNYLYFWDIFEKSNLFLENIIRTAKKDELDREVSTYLSSPVNDGGVWNLYHNIASKYGVVPASVMPETAHSNNTTAMVSIINESLRTHAMKLREMYKAKKSESEMRKAKVEGLKDVYRILALCLGEPPVSFTWRYETKDGKIKALENYTPMQFYKEITPENYTADHYIMIMNDPTREYYKVYEIPNYRNTYEGFNWIYLNLPNEEIKSAALASIKDNKAMYASCDVGKQFDRNAGILDMGVYDYESLFGIQLDMDKRERILSRQSGSSHAMTLIGCDVDEKEVPVKWEFENSWGAQHGHNGYLTFSDRWFDEYMFRVVIEKQYLSPKAQKAARQKPIQLDVWDYMF